jgi:hypothetical protein
LILQSLVTARRLTLSAQLHAPVVLGSSADLLRRSSK